MSVTVYSKKLYFSLLITVLAAALLASCSSRHGNGSDSTARIERLHRLDDSVADLAPSAYGEITKCMAKPADSMAYYEYALRLARYYWLSDNPERADTLLVRIMAFANRQHGDSLRINSLKAGALRCQGARRHNFHRDTRKTVEMYRRAYDLYARSETKFEMPKTCANLADAYILSNDLPNAAKWYRRALFLVDSLKMPEKHNITLYMGMAQIYLSLHDYDTALEYYRKTERCFNMMSPSMQAYYINNLGNFYYYTKNYPKALDTFLRMKRMLTERGMNKHFDMYLCKVNLADVYLNLGRIDDAARMLSEVEPYFREKGDEIAMYYCNTIRIGIDVRRKDTGDVERVLRTESRQSDIPYTMVGIRNEYLRQYYALIGDYRKAYDNLQNNIVYSDSLEHNRSNMRSAEIMARFTADTLKLHHDIALEHKNADIQRASTKTAVAVAVALLLLLSLLLWFVYARKKSLQSQVNIMNLKMDNVRNRISPHFMFNVLNNKILKSDEKEASELMELARLIRTNLDMSGMPYVSLDKELDFVCQYIRVERYLLGDDFSFDVDVAPDVDSYSTRVPSMFIQILTENAIVHGLKSKEGHKSLHISVSRDGSATVVVVADNGPGFNARRALKRGTGLGIISQTIAVANERNKRKMRFSMRNATCPDGTITGCEATLVIPDNITY